MSTIAFVYLVVGFVLALTIVWHRSLLAKHQTLPDISLTELMIWWPFCTLLWPIIVLWGIREIGRVVRAELRRLQ